VQRSRWHSHFLQAVLAARLAQWRGSRMRRAIVQLRKASACRTGRSEIPSSLPVLEINGAEYLARDTSYGLKGPDLRDVPDSVKPANSPA
jgi:hypothetical protein